MPLQMPAIDVVLCRSHWILCMQWVRVCVCVCIYVCVYVSVYVLVCVYVCEWMKQFVIQQEWVYRASKSGSSIKASGRREAYWSAGGPSMEIVIMGGARRLRWAGALTQSADGEPVRGFICMLWHCAEATMLFVVVAYGIGK